MEENTMFNLKKSFTVLSTKVLAASLAVAPVNADACTRAVYLGPNDDVITARSMDWNADIGTNLWIFPKGMERSGEAGRNSLRWTSKYGSVIASGFDISTTDGLNEAGLCANLLWLAESQYPAFDRSKPGLSVAAWAQYVLDNFATIQEAVNALRGEPFTVVTDTVPGETRLATLHLSMSDATGDSAIIEYIGGKQVIHHGRKYQVMTNSPIFDEQLALNEQCESREGVRRQRHVSRCPQFGQIASRRRQNSDARAFHPGRRSQSPQQRQPCRSRPFQTLRDTC
jgi:penicillin V acylase-like amidase (Ntn superfamily)